MSANPQQNGRQAIFRWSKGHFDVKPYRPDSVEEVFDLVAGCMRSYLVLRERVQRFNADAEIQAMLGALEVRDDQLGP